MELLVVKFAWPSVVVSFSIEFIHKQMLHLLLIMYIIVDNPGFFNSFTISFIIVCLCVGMRSMLYMIAYRIRDVIYIVTNMLLLHKTKKKHTHQTQIKDLKIYGVSKNKMYFRRKYKLHLLEKEKKD